MARIFDGGYYLYSHDSGYNQCVADNSIIVFKYWKDVQLFFLCSNFPLKMDYDVDIYMGDPQPFFKQFLDKGTS